MMLRKYESSLTINSLRLMCVGSFFLYIILFLRFNYSYFEYKSFNIYHFIFLGEHYSFIDGYKEMYRLLIGIFGAFFLFSLFNLLSFKFRTVIWLKLT